MGPKRSGHEASDLADYRTTLTKFCQEADVLIIPEVKSFPSVSDFKYFEKPETRTNPPADSEMEETANGCGLLQQPCVQVAFARGENGDYPSAIVCKGFYIEYALVQAIFMSFEVFPTVSCLKIEDCCISKDIVKILATLLADHTRENIVDLSLDGNPGIADELPLLLRTNLKHLSLRRCNLDDKAINLLSRELAYSSDREQCLLTLNLNMNCFGDEGAVALATALRTNRTLISLSLSGNRITNAGASSFGEVLGGFSLTAEETITRRRKTFDRLLLKKSILKKCVEDWKRNNEIESLAKVRFGDKGKKTKAYEGVPKRASAASRERKRSSSTRLDSREVMRGRRRSSSASEGAALSPEPSPSEMVELMQRVESEIPEDGHPFAGSEVSPRDGELWCDGSWKLGNLNLSHNKIDEHSIDRFLMAIYHQEKWRRPDRQGLLRLVVQPGNSIPPKSSKLLELECALRERSLKSSGQQDLLP